MSIEHYTFGNHLPYIKTNESGTILYKETFATVDDLSGLDYAISAYNGNKEKTKEDVYNLGEKYGHKGLIGYSPTLQDQMEIDVGQSTQQYNYLFSASVITALTIGTLIGILVAK